MSDAQTTTKKKLNIDVKAVWGDVKPKGKSQIIATGVLAVVSGLAGFVTGKLTSKGKKKDQ